LLGGFASTASPALRPGVHAFDARFQDDLCGEGAFCGTGMLRGFGAVKTHLALGPVYRDPANGCARAAGVRTLTPVTDAKSALRLSVKGAVCKSHVRGTFKVASGSGVFAGATGSGVIIGTLISRHESLRYRGVITLAGK